MVAGVINGDIYAQHGSGVQKIQLKWSSARKGRAVTDDAATTNVLPDGTLMDNLNFRPDGTYQRRNSMAKQNKT